MARWPTTIQGKLFVASIVVAALVVWLTGSVVWAIAAVLALSVLAVIVWYRPVRTVRRMDTGERMSFRDGIG